MKNYLKPLFMSFQSAYVTGNELIIDGGWSLWLTLPVNGNSYYDGQKNEDGVSCKDWDHACDALPNKFAGTSTMILLINFSLNRETLE